MKKNLLFLGLLFAGAATFFTACSDDDDPVPGAGNVPAHVNQAFSNKFPGATNVTWAQKKGYYVANFTMAKKRAAAQDVNEAWFTQEGKLGLTELEINLDDFKNAHAYVYEAWKANAKYGEAAGFIIDDIDLLERNGDKMLKVEVENKATRQEFDLYFTLDGVLVSAKQDLDDNDDDEENIPCPEVILHQLNQVYGQHLLVSECELEMEDGKEELEVEVLFPVGIPALSPDKAVLFLEKEITFIKDNKGDFVAVKGEIEIEEEELAKTLNGIVKQMPQAEAAIQNALGLTANAPWSEDDIEALELQFEELGNHDIKITLANGKHIVFTMDKKDGKFAYVLAM